MPMGHLIVGADPKHDHLVHLDENPLTASETICAWEAKSREANRGRRLRPPYPSEVHESLLYDLKTQVRANEDGAEVARSARADLLAGDIIVPTGSAAALA